MKQVGLVSQVAQGMTQKRLGLYLLPYVGFGEAIPFLIARVIRPSGGITRYPRLQLSHVAS